MQGKYKTFGGDVGERVGVRVVVGVGVCVWVGVSVKVGDGAGVWLGVGVDVGGVRPLP